MYNANIRNQLLSSFAQDQFGRKRKAARVADIVSPGIHVYEEFLRCTGAPQIEAAKRALWNMCYASPIAPPSLLFRRLISLQTTEPAQNENEPHRPRDHVKHLVYLYILGLGIFQDVKKVRERVENEISILKRKHGTRYEPANELFSSAWLAFVLSHDVAYPIERLASISKGTPKAPDSLEQTIRTKLIPTYRKYLFTERDDLCLRVIAELSAAIASSEVIEKDFGQIVYEHLDATDKEAFEKQFDEDSFPEYLSAEPFVNIGVAPLRVWESLGGGAAILCSIEDMATGDLLYVGSLDNTVELKTVSASKSKVNFRHIGFSGYTYDRKKYLVRYFKAKYISLESLILKAFQSDKLYGYLRLIANELLIHPGFRQACLDSEETSSALPRIAYALLCSDEIVAYSREDPFNEIDIDDSVIGAINYYLPLISELMSDAVLKELTTKYAQGNFTPGDIVGKVPLKDIGEGLVIEGFGLNYLVKRLKDKIKESSKSNIKFEPSAIDAVIKTFLSDRKHSVLGSLAYTIGGALVPKIQTKVMFFDAIGKIFSILRPDVTNVMERAFLKSHILPDRLTELDVDSDKFLENGYSSLDEFSVLNGLDTRERNLLKSVGVNYSPKEWRADHGLLSAYLMLVSLEWRNLALEEESTSAGQRFIYASIAKRHSNSIELTSKKIRLVAEMCFRAVALHNFYPDKSPVYNNLRHSIDKTPFTFFTILADGLQTNDRDEQYDPGLFDLKMKKMRPDDYYDIQIVDNRIVVYLSRKYADHSDVTLLKDSFRAYMDDIDALVDIRLR